MIEFLLKVAVAAAIATALCRVKPGRLTIEPLCRVAAGIGMGICVSPATHAIPLKVKCQKQTSLLLVHGSKIMIDRYDRIADEIRPANYGMNPAFVQRVYAARRAEAAKREAAENAAKRKAAALAMQIEAQRLAADAIQAEAEREAEIAGKFAVAKESRMVGTEILRLIESITGIDRNVITGGTKAQKIMRVRWDAICLIKHLRPDYSLPKIGRIMGGRDHTTVLNALGKRGWTGTGWRNGLPELATPELRQLIA